MSGLVLFRYDERTEIRVIRGILGDFGIVAADVARTLGWSSTAAMTRTLDDDEKGVHTLHTPGGDQEFTVITEGGLYSAVFRSRVEGAKDFKRWVTHEVLPAIRKHGGYLTPETVEQVLTDPDTIIRLATDLKNERAARIEAEEQAAALAAPASAWQHMAAAAGDYAVGDAAKILSRDPAIAIGRDRLFRYMQAEGWIYRGQDRRKSWAAYQTQVDCGRLVEKAATPFLNQKTGEMELPAPTIRITAKGLAELHKRLGGTAVLATMAVSA